MTVGKTKTRYDADTETMWVYRKFDKDKTLVPTDELNLWQSKKKAGQTEDGDPLKHVNYVFGAAETAEYNAQPLSFADLGVYVGSLDSPKEYDGETPDFSTKEDFGIS
jgi:hypothetical protein